MVCSGGSWEDPPKGFPYSGLDFVQRRRALIRSVVMAWAAKFNNPLSDFRLIDDHAVDALVDRLIEQETMARPGDPYEESHL